MSWQEQEYEGSEDQEQQREGGSGGGGGSKGNGLWWLLILLLIGGIGIASLGHGGSGGPTGSSGSFNVLQTAYQLAQSTESYRSSNPFGGNYGTIEIVLVGSDGTIQGTYTPPTPFQGFDGPGQHSEPKAVAWAAGQLSALRQQGALQGVAVHVVLFTQVRACDTCKNAARQTWAQQLDQAAGQHVAFSYWQITPGSPSGFNPADYPAGPSTPGGKHGRYNPPVSVRIQDLSEVDARP